jgi:hypothetical protein
MRTTAFLMGVLLLTLFTAQAFGAVPHTVSYQGRLTDSGDNPVADGDYQLRFRIYDEASGGASPLWDSGPRNVSVADGLFNYSLGDSVDLPDGLFADNADLWLGVTVGGDSEISPRTKLDASGWAMHAETAETSPGVTQYLDNSSVALTNGFSTLVAVDTITVPAAGYVLAQATANVSCFYASGTDAGMILEFRDETVTHLGDQEHFWVINSGMPAGDHEITMHIHRIFTVDAGSHEFNLVGADFIDAGNAFNVSRTVMTLTYIPQSFGEVATAGIPAFSKGKPRTIALSAAELTALRNRSLPDKEE